MTSSRRAPLDRCHRRLVGPCGNHRARTRSRFATYGRKVVGAELEEEEETVAEEEEEAGHRHRSRLRQRAF